MKVYLAGPITHRDDGDYLPWAQEISGRLKLDNIEAIIPMPQSQYMEAYEIKSEDSDVVLTIRDNWAATRCDVVLANFENSTKASIGTSIELGWASQAGVPIVAVIPKGNVHEHPMVLSIVSFRVETLNEGVNVVQALGGRRL